MSVEAQLAIATTALTLTGALLIRYAINAGRRP